jgi:hypothetical protein
VNLALEEVDALRVATANATNPATSAHARHVETSLAIHPNTTVLVPNCPATDWTHQVLNLALEEAATANADGPTTSSSARTKQLGNSLTVDPDTRTCPLVHPASANRVIATSHKADPSPTTCPCVPTAANNIKSYEATTLAALAASGNDVRKRKDQEHTEHEDAAKPEESLCGALVNISSYLLTYYNTLQKRSKHASTLNGREREPPEPPSRSRGGGESDRLHNNLDHFLTAQSNC